jgi:transcriptional regulator with XRE-family HTH domain
MAKARSFNELRNKLPAESRTRIDARVKASLHEMALDELRAARELTQERLAETLGIKQASVSKIERRADLYVSTLARFIEAMGGELEIRAVFPEGSVRHGSVSRRTLLICREHDPCPATPTGAPPWAFGRHARG